MIGAAAGLAAFSAGCSSPEDYDPDRLERRYDDVFGWADIGNNYWRDNGRPRVYAYTKNKKSAKSPRLAVSIWRLRKNENDNIRSLTDSCRNCAKSDMAEATGFRHEPICRYYSNHTGEGPTEKTGEDGATWTYLSFVNPPARIYFVAPDHVCRPKTDPP